MKPGPVSPPSGIHALVSELASILLEIQSLTPERLKEITETTRKLTVANTENKNLLQAIATKRLTQQEELKAVDEAKEKLNTDIVAANAQHDADQRKLDAVKADLDKFRLQLNARQDAIAAREDDVARRERALERARTALQPEVA